MKLQYLVLPGAAVALAALILAPAESSAFSTIGGKLGMTQRDVRVFNNFTDSAANNNTTITSDWPGYDGAELSIWKGAAEWASEPHGLTGAGDRVFRGGSWNFTADGCRSASRSYSSPGLRYITFGFRISRPLP